MFGLFRRRRTKWEIARDTVSEALHNALEHLPIETIEDKLETLREEAADVAAQGAKKAKGLSRRAGSMASTKATSAAATAGNVADRAGDVADLARETLGDTLGRVREGTSHLAHGAQERIEHLRQAAPALELPPLRQKFKQAREARHQALETVQETVEDHYPQLEVNETSSKWLWFAVGLGVGTIVALLLAPAAGRRSRAAIKDKLHQGQQEASELGKAAAGKAADLSRRAAGKVHEITGSLHGDENDDDGTIADRVRTALGQFPGSRDLERFNVDSCDGVVTLRGPMVDEAQSAEIEAAVRGVEGVRDVKMDLLISDPENEATFVG